MRIPYASTSIIYLSILCGLSVCVSRGGMCIKNAQHFYLLICLDLGIFLELKVESGATDTNADVDDLKSGRRQLSERFEALPRVSHTQTQTHTHRQM